MTATQEEAIAKAREAIKDLLFWDKLRNYIIPYRARDPLIEALAALDSVKEPDTPVIGGGNCSVPPVYSVKEPEPVVLSDEWTPCIKLPVIVHVRKQREGESHVSTREGITPVKPNDLIMRGVSGEEYPIGSDIFNATYTAPPSVKWTNGPLPEGTKLYTAPPREVK
jgi:hypothetical protein